MFIFSSSGSKPFIERRIIVVPWDILVVSKEVMSHATVIALSFYGSFLVHRLLFLSASFLCHLFLSSAYPRISMIGISLHLREEFFLFYITSQLSFSFFSLRRNVSKVETNLKHFIGIKVMHFLFQFSTDDYDYATFWIFAVNEMCNEHATSS